MPYEAFANVLSQLSGDYARNTLAQKERDIRRQEQLADVESQREFAREQTATGVANAKDLATFNANLDVEKVAKMTDAQIEAELKRIREVEPAKFESTIRLAAKAMNVPNADTLPIDQLIALKEQYANDKATKDAVRTAFTQIEISNATRADRKAAEFKENELEAKSALGLYNQSKTRIEQLRSANPLLQGPLSIDELAEQKVNAELTALRTLPPGAAKARVAAIANALGNPKIKSVVDVEAALSSPAAKVQYATDSNMVSADDVKAINARQISIQRGESQAAAAEIAGLTKLMGELAPKLVGFGMDPNVAWEQQTMVKNPSYWSAPTEQPVAPAPAAPVAPDLSAVNVPRLPQWATPTTAAATFAPMTAAAAPAWAAPVRRAPAEPASNFVDPIPSSGQPSFWGTDRDNALNRQRVASAAGMVLPTIATMGRQVYDGGKWMASTLAEGYDPRNWKNPQR